MAKLLITLVKSGIGHPLDQKRTIKALGLRRLNQTVSHDDNGPIRGMINKIKHLIKVEETSQ